MLFYILVFLLCAFAGRLIGGVVGWLALSQRIGIRAFGGVLGALIALGCVAQIALSVTFNRLSASVVFFSACLAWIAINSLIGAYVAARPMR